MLNLLSGTTKLQKMESSMTNGRSPIKVQLSQPLTREQLRDSPAERQVPGERRDSMARDIDYAAIAVHTAVVEKFARQSDLTNLTVTANERTISVVDGPHAAEGARHDLLAAVRAADSYANLWEILAMHRKPQ
jgi:hypothetical protein